MFENMKIELSKENINFYYKNLNIAFYDKKNKILDLKKEFHEIKSLLLKSELLKTISDQLSYIDLEEDYDDDFNLEKMVNKKIDFILEDKNIDYHSLKKEEKSFIDDILNQLIYVYSFIYYETRKEVLLKLAKNNNNSDKENEILMSCILLSNKELLSYIEKNNFLNISFDSKTKFSPMMISEETIEDYRTIKRIEYKKDL